MDTSSLPIWTLIPFAVMLLLIATAPLFFNKFWEKNSHKLLVTMAVALPTAIYLICIGLGHQLSEQIFGDYIPFIVLLLSLYVVTGGIKIKGDIVATPITNGLLLLLGYILASFMGTTGAAMLLIRPLMDFNRKREHRGQTVLFFIAMVANCGGILTPLGDPPLFLLYLRGAPFGWFGSLFYQWLFVGCVLLFIYVIIDSIIYGKEPLSVRKAAMRPTSPIRIKGRQNIIYLGLIILSVIFINEHYIPMMASKDCPLPLRYLREVLLTGVTALSLLTTSKTTRVQNNFSWEPILEVAIIFIGIFTTMTPALMYLSQHATDLGLTAPWQFYYSTGMLSSFLDNSPTAVAFHSVASGLNFSVMDSASFVAGIPDEFLRAIALGSVFFGSMTYIGNGPNFMVKAIAEKEGVKMPSFFGYIFKFSLIFLLPVYILAQLIFI